MNFITIIAREIVKLVIFVVLVWMPIERTFDKDEDDDTRE